MRTLAILVLCGNMMGASSGADDLTANDREPLPPGDLARLAVPATMNRQEESPDGAMSKIATGRAVTVTYRVRNSSPSAVAPHRPTMSANGSPTDTSMKVAPLGASPEANQ